MTLVSYSLVVKALGLVNDHSTIDDIDRRYLTFSGHVVTHYFLFSTQIRTYRDVHECCRVFSGFSLFMSGCLAAHIRYYFILSKLRGRSTYSSLFSTIVIFSNLNQPDDQWPPFLTLKKYQNILSPEWDDNKWRKQWVEKNV